MSRPLRVTMRPNFRAKLSQLPSVQKAVREKADAIAAEAERIAAAEQYEAHATVEEGIRPNGRAFARVLSRDIDQEFGTWGKKRRRILGRAAQRATS